jgi:hypothetical protein
MAGMEDDDLRQLPILRLFVCAICFAAAAGSVRLAILEVNHFADGQFPLLFTLAALFFITVGIGVLLPGTVEFMIRVWKVILEWLTII